MVAVHVAQQHEMDRAQSRIVAPGHIVRRVVEETDAGWILENDCAIVRAQRVVGAVADFPLPETGTISCSFSISLPIW